MIIIVEHGIVLSAAQALDNDQYYAMLDSGTNAIIVPLHPCSIRVCKEKLQSVKSQVPQSLVLLFKCMSLMVQEDW